MKFNFNNFLLKYLLVIAVFMFFIPLNSWSQTTYVPDDNFENYLEANGMGDGIPLNDYVLTSNINTVTNLTVSFLSISDLTGIEDFAALSVLDAQGNGGLTSVDLSQNSLLSDARFNSCNLGSLDLSNNPQLTILTCGGNNLTALDVSNNPLLTTLDCWSNSISVLDLSQNTALTSINCNSNQIASLDFSNNPNMINISCNSNQLTSLDVTSLSSLQILWCPGNSISVLDLSQNSQLNTIRCENNTLHRLDVKNGNNTNVTQFFSTGNPSLECINVDDSTYSANNWTNIDSQQYFGESCYCSLIVNSQTNVSCYGGYNGSLVLTGTGGTGYYNYVLGFLNQFTGTLIPFTNTGTGFYATPINLTNVPANCYTATITDSLGCADTTTICITEPDSIYSVTTMTQCNQAIWNFNVYNTSGIYSAVLTAANGCDSSAILDVTLIFSDSSFSTINSCDSYIWNGTTYTSSGTYTYISPGSNGCDSVATLYLTINNSSSSSFTIISCDSYAWDGVTYTSTGLYTNTYTASNGCDSTVSLDLTINNSSTNTVTINSCDSYMWDGVTYSTTGNYTNVYTSSNGCDSTVTLDLTINNSSTSTVIITACDSYVWDGVSYTFTGNYTNVYTSSNGCDSTVTLDLTINSSSTNTVTINSCDSYIWDGTSYTTSGQYINVYTALNGCDSTVTLDLTLTYSDTSFMNITACDSFTLNDVTYNQSGLFYQILSADSLTGFNYVGTYNGSTYYISENPEYWAAAQSNCIANGGNLVCISDANENDFVSNILPGQQFWLGYTDETVEGSFVWVDGSNHTYSKWAPTEPSNSGPTGNEDYTLINSGEGGSNPFDGFWNDIDDNLTQYLYVLELPFSHLTSNGCDSVIALNLTINVSDTSYTNITACDSVEWNGTWYDSSGTYYSNTSLNNNYSMSFDGIDDFISCQNNITGNYSEFSIEGWINVNNFPNVNSGKIVDIGGPNSRFIVETKSNQSLHFEISENNILQDGLASVVGLQSNEWIHFAAVWDSDQYVKLFINGNEASSNVIPPNLTSINLSSQAGIFFGSRYSNSDFFDGLIDRLSIWGKALDEIEIQNFMNCPPNGSENELYGLWNFEEGNGNTAYDQTSNGNDGTINGATYDTNVPQQSCQLTNSNGCDSVVVLNLTINNSSTNTVTITACDSFDWDGVTYTSTGLYTNLYADINGCDSTVTLDLTINNSSTSTVTITSCDSFDWDGVTYTTTGLYTNLYTDVNGCDSTVTLDLTINNSSTNTVTITACDSFDWDGVTYTSTGLYTNLYADINGCDSTVTLDLTINNSSTSTVTITSCDSFDWDGVTYTTTGLYTNLYTDVNGCDSTVTLDLTINNSSTNTVTITACDSFDWDGVTYTSTGLYTNLYADINGCDSTVTLDLTINNSSTSTVTITSCDSFDWDGVTYTTTGLYTNLYTDVNGCDSTVTLDLTINNSSTNTVTITACDSFDWDGVTYTSTGLYTNLYADINGCDSTVTLDLTINNSSTSTVTITSCDSFDWDGVTYTTTGLYTNLYTDVNGCDSTVILDLTIVNTIFINQNDTSICFGDSITLSLSSSNFNACVLPSNLQTNLTGFYPFCGNANDESSFSNNGSVNGAVLSNDRFNNSNSAYDFDGSNDYIDLGSPSANSGSLTISSWVKTTNVVNGQRWIVSRSSWTTGAWQLMTYNGYAASEFDWGGQLVGNTFIADGQWHHILTIYDASTNYRYLYVDGVQDGIDMTRGPFNENGNQMMIGKRPGSGNTFNGSIDDVVLYNRVLSTSEIQDLYNSSSNNILWSTGDSSSTITVNPTQTTSYWLETTENGFSCRDSVVITVLDTSLTSFTITSCDSYEWDGVTYTSTGQYTNLYTNLNGCDSTVTLDLTINNSSTNTVTITACDSFDWDGVTYTTTGLYTNVYTDINSCDSTVTLDLTINNSSTSTITITACDSYDWDGVTYNTTGQYTNLYTDINGCDSTVILDLTINNSSTNTVTVTSCDSFVWDGVTYTNSGQYTNLYTDVNGCDSSVTLDLTINYSSTNSFTITACDSYVWDGVTYTNTGLYTIIYSGTNGCDSAVTLDLNIINSTVNTLTVTECDSYNWDGVTYTTTGLYTNIYTGLNGCDSIVTLDLIIISSPVIIQDDTTICYGDSITLETDLSSQISNSQDVCVLSEISSNLQADLIAYYPFCGDANDISLNSNNGNVVGANLSVNRFGDSLNSYVFDGVGDYIELVNSTSFSSLDSNISISSWIYPENYNDGTIIDRDICGNSPDWHLSWRGNGNAARVLLRVNNQYLYSGNYNSNQWLHIVAVKNNTNFELYINNQYQGSVPVPINLINTSLPIYIGDQVCNSSSEPNFDGRIDDVGVWSRALDSAEVNQLYNSNFPEYVWSTGDSSATITVMPTQTTTYILEKIDNGISCFDSVTVTINDTSSSYSQAVSCYNYTWNGITYSATGLYSYTSTNYIGCDSVAFLDLIINSDYNIIDSIGVCSGDSIMINGNYYSTLGTYVDSFFTSSGCDSIVSSVLSYLPIGCTDSTSFNYDPLAQCDDNSCIMAIYGCLDSNAINYYPSANFDDGSCIYLGCTDSTASNYNPAASIDDGSCVYAFCSDPVPFGFFTNDITDVKARINWNNMNDSACMVWKYFVRYREVGTNTWTTKSAGVGSGLCNVGLNTTSKVLQNLNPSTTYEYKMKAFYCGGTESSYSSPVQFTTGDLCPEMTNLSAQTFYFNPNKVRFNWDTTGLYTFARIVLRVDTIGSSWQGAGGYGIYYPNLSVNKYGMQAGEFYRAQGRTFCDSNITSYRSWWTPPIFWQQPGSSRLNGGHTISNLDVYPNPSRDIFNISFVSEELQNLKLRILNILGEQVYVEEKEQYIGEYTKQINLNEYRKGVYFLEIETNNGVINKKLILQ